MSRQVILSEIKACLNNLENRQAGQAGQVNEASDYSSFNLGLFPIHTSSTNLSSINSNNNNVYINQEKIAVKKEANKEEKSRDNTLFNTLIGLGASAIALTGVYYSTQDPYHVMKMKFAQIDKLMVSLNNDQETEMLRLLYNNFKVFTLTNYQRKYCMKNTMFLSGASMLLGFAVHSYITYASIVVGTVAGAYHIMISNDVNNDTIKSESLEHLNRIIDKLMIN